MDLLERDIALMALIEKGIEINNYSMNSSKDPIYRDIGTMLYSINQRLQENIRIKYVDNPLPEIDSSKYKVSTDDDDDANNPNATPQP